MALKLPAFIVLFSALLSAHASAVQPAVDSASAAEQCLGYIDGCALEVEGDNIAFLCPDGTEEGAVAVVQDGQLTYCRPRCEAADDGSASGGPESGGFIVDIENAFDYAGSLLKSVFLSTAETASPGTASSPTEEEARRVSEILKKVLNRYVAEVIKVYTDTAYIKSVRAKSIAKATADLEKDPTNPKLQKALSNLQDWPDKKISEKLISGVNNLILFVELLAELRDVKSLQNNREFESIISVPNRKIALYKLGEYLNAKYLTKKAGRLLVIYQQPAFDPYYVFSFYLWNIKGGGPTPKEKDMWGKKAKYNEVYIYGQQIDLLSSKMPVVIERIVVMYHQSAEFYKELDNLVAINIELVERVISKASWRLGYPISKGMSAEQNLANVWTYLRDKSYYDLVNPLGSHLLSRAFPDDNSRKKEVIESEHIDVLLTHELQHVLDASVRSLSCDDKTPGDVGFAKQIEKEHRAEYSTMINSANSLLSLYFIVDYIFDEPVRYYDTNPTRGQTEHYVARKRIIKGLAGYIFEGRAGKFMGVFTKLKVRLGVTDADVEKLDPNKLQDSIAIIIAFVESYKDLPSLNAALKEVAEATFKDHKDMQYDDAWLKAVNKEIADDSWWKEVRAARPR